MQLLLVKNPFKSLLVLIIKKIDAGKWKISHFDERQKSRINGIVRWRFQD